MISTIDFSSVREFPRGNKNAIISIHVRRNKIATNANETLQLNDTFRLLWRCYCGYVFVTRSLPVTTILRFSIRRNRACLHKMTTCIIIDQVGFVLFPYISIPCCCILTLNNILHLAGFFKFYRFSLLYEVIQYRGFIQIDTGRDEIVY